MEQVVPELGKYPAQAQYDPYNYRRQQQKSDYKLYQSKNFHGAIIFNSFGFLVKNRFFVGLTAGEGIVWIN
jgi:hypothetical protein